MTLNEFMTPSLSRAARAVLNWSMAELAERTGVAATTIRAYERGEHCTTRMIRVTIAETFKDAGIEFVGGENCAPGLVLKKPELLSNPPEANFHGLRADFK